MINRYAYFLALISERGRGKTHNLIKVIEKRLEVGGRALVIVPDLSEEAWFNYPTILAEDFEEKFNPNFEGVLIIEYDYKKKTTIPFLYNLFNRMILKDLTLVFDDPKYFKSTPPEELELIFSRARQYSVDFLTTVHGYDQLPPCFFPYMTIFGLGATATGIVNRKEHLGEDYEVHKSKRENINRIANVEKGNPNYYYFEFFYRNGTNL